MIHYLDIIKKAIKESEDSWSIKSQEKKCKMERDNK